MIDVASCFYGRVYDTILECLMRIVWKSKKPISDLKSGPIQSICQKKVNQDQDQSRTTYQFGRLDWAAVHNRTAAKLRQT
jgi:hypothetical protein